MTEYMYYAEIANVRKERLKMKYTLGDKIYDGVKKDIITNVYTPNMIISEAQIAEKYAVSKAPVRTALHRLCEDDYLISYARKGYLVLNTSIVDYSAAQQLRYAIESLTVANLIMYAPDNSIEKLRTIAALEYPSDRKYTTVNAQFHMTMARLTENRYLVQCLDMIMSELSKIYTYLDSKNQPVEDQNCHAYLLDAIEARDRREALQWLKKDIIDDRVAKRFDIDLFDN